MILSEAFLRAMSKYSHKKACQVLICMEENLQLSMTGMPPQHLRLPELNYHMRREVEHLGQGLKMLEGRDYFIGTYRVKRVLTTPNIIIHQHHPVKNLCKVGQVVHGMCLSVQKCRCLNCSADSSCRRKDSTKND